MFRINDDRSSNGIIKESRNDSSSIIIHEHDFVSVRVKEEEKEQKSIICLTCGSLYCEKCGKLLLTIHRKNYMQHNLYN
jgi:endonuclease IV